jgi:DoxX-like family
VYGLSIYSMIALIIAAIVAVIGATQLAGPRFVIAAYNGWDYPKRVRVITGLLDVVAAAMLAAPVTRGWGLALTAILTFGSVVTFLSHRQYRFAIPAIGLMAALIPATVSVQRSGQVQFSAERPAASALVSQSLAVDSPASTSSSGTGG